MTTTDVEIMHVPSPPSARKIWDEIQSAQENCRKRLLDEWQAERAYACLQVLRDYADHEAVDAAYVRIYPDGRGSGRYSYDGTHCTVELEEGEWQINARRGGTRNRQSKNVAAVLRVPVSDASNPDMARDLRSKLEEEGWNPGSGSEMRIYTGNMSPDQ